ncbi:hypothetical protein H0H87_000044 [Tephrocybe sp. NHM501043]|nr:hypothetical protein H0H87_000044 [Tephrocybe sp. NHM501043]
MSPHLASSLPPKQKSAGENFEIPHAELVDLFDADKKNILTQEFAWSLAHDSNLLSRYRTPLCLLYPPKITAAACYVLAQRIADGPNSPSLDARISASSPTSSLPTPPTHKPPSPDASRYAIEYFTLSEAELASVAEALGILLEFYSTQDMKIYPHVLPLLDIPPPSTPKPYLYVAIASPANVAPANGSSADVLGRTPNSSHGGDTPAGLLSASEVES